VSSAGSVTLRGSVRWWFQKDLVDNAITGIAGVRGIANLLTIDRTDRLDHEV
jgi:osmotically-inducible protein OsmY